MAVELKQLADYTRCIGYLFDHPAGPWRPARVAFELGLNPVRVRRWLALLETHGWIAADPAWKQKHYRPAPRFEAWGRAFAQRIIGGM